MKTTLFQRAGHALALLSDDFSIVWGSRNLSECDVERAKAARAAARSYLRGAPAISALIEQGFEVEA